MTTDSTLKLPDIDVDEFEIQAEFCKSLSHPFRLKLIELLKIGQKNVSEIEKETNQPQPFISQHLKVLRDKKIVICERKKQERYYSLTNSKILEICQLLSELADKKEIYTK
jgi:ArsR family transcriptional regulator